MLLGSSVLSGQCYIRFKFTLAKRKKRVRLGFYRLLQNNLFSDPNKIMVENSSGTWRCINWYRCLAGRKLLSNVSNSLQIYTASYLTRREFSSKRL